LIHYLGIDKKLVAKLQIIELFLGSNYLNQKISTNDSQG